MAGCLILAVFGLIGVARDGLDTLAGIALGLSAAVGLFNVFFLMRDAFGRVILSLAPEELRVRQHPVLLSVPLAIPKLDIRSIRVCARVDDHDDPTGLYDLVIESKHGPERIVDGTHDAGALVALAELIGKRIGVKCETRTTTGQEPT